MIEQPLWSPAQEHRSNSQMWTFLQAVQNQCAAQVTDYSSLHRWSCDHPELFWPFLAQYLDIKLSGYSAVMVADHQQQPQTMRWFPGATLNYAEAVLRHRGPQPAIIYRGEDSCRRQLSRDQLRELVARIAHGLKNMGVQRGDRVVGFMANTPDTIAIMLAAVSIGAIWSSCSPDFGSQGVIDRFGQVAPKLLFASDGYHYHGKAIDCRVQIGELATALPSLEQVVVVPFQAEQDIAGIAKSCLLSDFLSDNTELVFDQVPFDHPLCILYSSGTTGTPKGMVHGHGGTLLQHAKELVLHTDLREHERFFYFTTCGWMMWNWLVSGLFIGTTLVLFDGSPFHPGPETLWQMADQEQISVFGTSARYLAAVHKSGFQPVHACDLSHLRALLSTGSPLPPEGFDFVYQSISSDIMLSSISGGSDIISCFALGNPILPVYRGQLQCRGLAMDVAFYNHAGQAIDGERGELVCRTPFPSRPVKFWNDLNGERYHSAYFSRFPGVWAHGDYGELTPEEGVVIHGRSDAVLNPGGVRIGTAEIYRQVEKVQTVLESLAVGQGYQGDERIVLFVRLRDGVCLGPQLEADIRRVIRENASPRHVPALIIQAPDLPRTVSGKLSELAVKAIILGHSVNNTEALANPESLDFFRQLEPLA